MLKGLIEQLTSSFPDFKSGTSDALYSSAKLALQGTCLLVLYTYKSKQDCDKKQSVLLQKQMLKGWIEQPTSSFPDFKSGASDTFYH